MAAKPHNTLLSPSLSIPTSPAATAWDIRCSFHTLTALLMAALVLGVVYLTGEAENFLFNGERDNNSVRRESVVDAPPPPPPSKCDMFSGKWVYDNKSYPLYKEQECAFMSDQLACQKFGRKDLEYQHWRWQPNQCDLPRFNATLLLEKLRNKRLVFVGDSLNRGQWVSMVCLVDSSIISPSLKSITYKYNASLIIFKAKEYNATIEFYWAPLLVESNSDDPVHHRLPERIVRANSIEKHGSRWTDADYLVFNTYLWWRRPHIKVLWGSFDGRRDGIYKEVEMVRSYEMALKTWSDWLEINVNRSKTHLFFVSMSPIHERAEEWGKEVGENCYGETEPIKKYGYQGNGSDPKMMRLVEAAIDELKGRGLNVGLINVTQQSEYRKDGHPSIYRKQWDSSVTQEKMTAKPTAYADCIHWCLPGVPDVWNELLYAHIFNYAE